MSSDRATPAATPRRVLVVDDSAFMRCVIAEMVDACPGFRTVATARDGAEALRLVHAAAPDVVTLDVEMPGADGLDTLGAIMRDAPRPVIMLTAAEGDRGAADPAARARALGAVDFVAKPSGPISLDLDAVRDRLHDALRAAARRGDAPRVYRDEEEDEGRAHVARRAVVIAASTGGPAALAAVLPRLPRDFAAAVLVVQHMPPGFTASLARRLDAQSAVRVTEARDGEPLVSGRVYVAAGGSHLRVRHDGVTPRCAVNDDAPLWGVRPAADHLFASAALAFGSSALGVVLTGMGRDGAAGLLAVRRAGGGAIVQDAATSTVAGMPNAALAAAGADSVLPLAEIAEAIVYRMARLPALPA